MENTARCWLFISFRSKIVKHISPSFNSDDWLFEIKHDGFRVLSIRDVGQRALEHSAGLALTAAGFFGQKYVRGSSQRELVAASRELQDMVGKLRTAAVARGWDKNPFPDYWKIHDAPKIRA